MAAVLPGHPGYEALVKLGVVGVPRRHARGPRL